MLSSFRTLATRFPIALRCARDAVQLLTKQPSLGSATSMHPTYTRAASHPLDMVSLSRMMKEKVLWTSPIAVVIAWMLLVNIRGQWITALAGKPTRTRPLSASLHSPHSRMSEPGPVSHHFKLERCSLHFGSSLSQCHGINSLQMALFPLYTKVTTGARPCSTIP